ncbi:MAG: hypothetical protein V1847_05350 [Candidatus Diapherotrites archaeon]
MDLGPRRHSRTQTERTDCTVREKRFHGVAFATLALKKTFEELSRGKFEEKELFRFLERAMADLKANPFCGIRIPEKQWPKEYVQKYNINNLYKYDLPKGWRLIYSIRGNEVEIISVVIEWFSHPEYERRFRY